MLCILFIAARMRALQIDPLHGNPQPWAQTCFYICSWAVVFQVFSSIIFPLLDKNAQLSSSSVQGQVVIIFSKRYLRIFGVLIRYLPLLCIYGGAVAIVASVHMSKGPPLSTTMSCVIGLTTLYFIVFTLVYIAQSAAEFGEGPMMRKVLACLDAGQKTVMFAPMLCLLFMAARLRALQLARTEAGEVPPGAAPQEWVQQGMLLATGAVFVQVLMAYLAVLALGDGTPHAPGDKDDLQATMDAQHVPKSGEAQDTKPEEESTKRAVTPPLALAIGLDVVKYLCLLAMYGGAMAVMVGIVQMTPEAVS